MGQFSMFLWMRKRNETSCVNTKRTALPEKNIHSILCALESINFKEAHSIQCVLLNVFTQQKVREWSTATGPPLSLPNALPLIELSKFLSQRSFNAFFQCATSRIWVFGHIVFSLSYQFSLSIKQIFPNKFTCMTGLFPSPSEKKKIQ